MINLVVPRVVKNWAHSSEIVTANESAIWHPSGFGRRYSMVDSARNWELAFSEFGLKPSSVEPEFKIFTGNHYMDGVNTQQHQDIAPEGMAHVRCNVMVKKPDSGGMPLFGDDQLDVEAGDMWLVLASLERHGSTPMFGGERIIFSYGALVPIDEVRRIISA